MAEIAEVPEMIDATCPQCHKVCGTLLSGSYGGYSCKHCGVKFVGHVVGRTLLVVLGEPYRRGRPCEVKVQVEPLLPKAKERYTRPEVVILPVPGLVVDA